MAIPNSNSNELPPQLWLGGGSGSGKTTISRILTLRFDIAWYRIDSHAYVLHRRMAAHGLVEELKGSHDQRWLEPSPPSLVAPYLAGPGATNCWTPVSAPRPMPVASRCWRWTAASTWRP